MNFIQRSASAAAHAVASVRNFSTLYGMGGVVGIYYTVKVSRARRRVHQVGEYMERERELHRDNMRTLQHEHAEAIDAQQSITFEASRFWAGLTAKAQ